MRSRILLRLGLAVFCLGTAAVGCTAPSALQTRISAQSRPEICRIAVMPFENWTRNDQAGLMAHRIFLAEIIRSGAFDVEPEGEIGVFRLRHRLYPGETLAPAQYSDLATQMGVDAIIRGRITELGRDSSRGTREIPYSALQVDLFAVQQGQPVLSTIHRRFGDEYRHLMHFGVVTTTTGLLTRMSREIIQDWLEKGVGNCQQRP